MDTESKALIAVGLSVVIMGGSMVLQTILFPPLQPETDSSAVPTAEPERTSVLTDVLPAPDPEGVFGTGETFVRETDVFRLIFSKMGGVLTSVQLKEFKNADGTPVEMVIGSDARQFPFGISFGDYQASETDAVFNFKESVDANQLVLEFFRTYLSATGVHFTLRKTYLFYPDEYMMELKISIENSVDEIPVIGTGEFAYTLSSGAQIGPRFVKLDGRNEYRMYVYYAKGEKKEVKVGSGTAKDLDQRVNWAGITGKYFSLIAIPDATRYGLVFDSRKLNQEHE